MTTSGTTLFNLDIADIIEEAYERAGYEARTGYDARTARRSLNLLLSDWSNRGVNQWTVQEVSTPLTNGVNEYALGTDTVGILEAVIRDTSNGNNSDTECDRISFEEYLNYPDKDVTGHPVQFALLRGRDNPTLFLYPTPSQTTFFFVHWRIRQMEDVDAMAQDADVPNRFLPALVAGLAWELAMKKPTNSTTEETIRRADAAKLRDLKTNYEELFARAADEDRDRASLFIIPRLARRGGM